jgi:TetR/AcrR family tetracycline transcriptional repressor
MGTRARHTDRRHRGVPPRERREPLTRERVIDAALVIMDAEGLEAVTMRRVARSVGVEAMSLYNHVRDKQDLLQGVCDRVMAGFDFPSPKGGWDDRCRAAARSWRRLLQAHPDVMRLFAQTHGPSPTSVESLRPTEFALSLLKEAGLSDRDTVQAFHAFGGYIQGFVMMEGGSIGHGPTAGDPHNTFATTVPSETFPCLQTMGQYFEECDADEQFEFGLDLLLAGLKAKTRTQAAVDSPLTSTEG